MPRLSGFLSIVSLLPAYVPSGTITVDRMTCASRCRLGPEYPKVFPGMQSSPEAQAEFFKQMVPDWLNAQPTPHRLRPSTSRRGLPKCRSSGWQAHRAVRQRTAPCAEA